MAEAPTFTGTVSVQMFVPDGQVVTYADYVTVQATDFSHLVTFFQVQPPALSTPEEAAAFKQRPIVPAYCVARFALPRPTAQKLLEELQRNLAKPIGGTPSETK